MAVGSATRPAMAPSAAAFDPVRGIALKVASTLLFSIMIACVKWSAPDIPTGEIVFARSFFALGPVLALLAWRGQLGGVLATRHFSGHLWRSLVGATSMALWFVALWLLPLPEAMALGFASPLFTVMLAALFLGEVIRPAKWWSVAVGFLGILLIQWPRLGEVHVGEMHTAELIGGACAFGSAFAAALAMILVRSLTASESTPSIVVYFSLNTSIFALATLPFGWVWPDGAHALALVATGLIGGVAQLLMTQSYRLAHASTIATFDYTSMVWSLLIAFLVFGEAPTAWVLAGSAIVIGAGIAIILGERRAW